jgi:hypothetical protein
MVNTLSFLPTHFIDLLILFLPFDPDLDSRYLDFAGIPRNTVDKRASGSKDRRIENLRKRSRSWD